MMTETPVTLSATFARFFDSEKAAGLVLLGVTIFALALANSPWGAGFAALWHLQCAGMSLEHWVNDGLMAVFFLFVGLELEREFYSGELAQLRNALLPIIAALGGICVPTLIHFALNGGTPTQAGAGIPMATDIAFALGVLALLGRQVPASLKVFLTALAVMDDLGAIVVIALFYAGQLSVGYLVAALAVAVALGVCNRVWRVMALTPYLLGGALMWYFMLRSGIHATIAGVLLAFAIPFSAKAENTASPSHRLENALHKPVAFVILPLFALANTAIVIGPGWQHDLASANSLGIMAGLLLGKPLGIALFSLGSVWAGLCRLPEGLSWRHVVGAGLLGGIGFTMSIFITNLAYAGAPQLIDGSKLAVLAASVLAGSLGYGWLRWAHRAPA